MSENVYALHLPRDPHPPEHGVSGPEPAGGGAASGPAGVGHSGRHKAVLRRCAGGAERHAAVRQGGERRSAAGQRGHRPGEADQRVCTHLQRAGTQR